MQVTNSLQIQTNHVPSSNENSLKKSEQSHLTEAYAYSKESVQITNLLYNYTPNEIGMKSNVNLVKPLAEKSVREGKQIDRESINYEFNKLNSQSISIVFPDQKTLHKPAMRAIIKLRTEETRPLGEMTLLNYLIEHDNIKIKTNTIIKTTKSFAVYTEHSRTVLKTVRQ